MIKKSVLIYGEYSGYGKSLADGFKQLGYKSEVFSFSGDGFKKINSGITLPEKNKIQRYISIIKLIPTFLKFKNIIIINPEFVSRKNLGFLILSIFKLTRKRIILMACGDDTPFIKYGLENIIPNWPYSDIPLPQKDYFLKEKDIFTNNLIASLAFKIIPVMYDYRVSWEQTKFKNKLTKTIPLACDGELQPIKKTKDKIVIMHGINRIDFKGTKVVKSALNEIEKKYPNDVEIIYPEHLPLTEYLEIMKRVDIAIDQTKGNSYGMNAIYSMFSGHVVLAPANDLFLNDINLQDSPIVKIKNTKESIVNSLSLLIEAKNMLDDKKKASQEYAVNVHSPVKIAEKIEHYLI
uniref:Gt1 n=1 Tax=Proteus vulgaris TaxID=585 RepID=A0A385JMH8_PROVU|nr:gt1 [Proteus vulgaris]